MKKTIFSILSFGILALIVLAPGMSQPPGGKDKGPKKDKKGPPPYELGKVLPPFVREGLELTPEQEKAIEDLEKEVRAKLLKILTEKQVESLKELKDPKGPPKDNEPGQPFPGGDKGPKKGGGFKGKDTPPDR